MIGNRKEERRVWTVPLHVIRKAQHPVRIDWLQFWTKKAGIHTGPAQTECHRSTTCATTTSTTWLFKLEITSCAVGCWQGWVMLPTAQASFEAPRVKKQESFYTIVNETHQLLALPVAQVDVLDLIFIRNIISLSTLCWLHGVWSNCSAATVAQPQVENFVTHFCFDRQKNWQVMQNWSRSRTQ